MSLGISPTQASSFPSPPAAVGSLPRTGGILINKSDDGARVRRPSEPTSPILPDIPSGGVSPAIEKRLSLTIPEGSALLGTSSNVSGSGSGGGSASQRIRFAPLPDPTRPRSLSTGEDPHWTGDEQGSHQTVVVTDVRGYDNALESEEDDDDDDERHKRGRRWSKSMSKSMALGGVDWGSGWKGTKKILTMGLIGDEEEGYANGAPLKKSVSTGGFIGSWTAETDRKKTMLGTSPSSGPSLLPPSRDSSTHRRGSSLEANGQLAASPVAKPVKMLNGRVYGGRRASEATLAEKKQREKREKAEPEFIEWGHGKGGGGMGSNQPSRGGLLDDEDDGSGMAWARKRRQRREQEEKEKQEREARASASQDEQDTSAVELDDEGESDSSQSQTQSQPQTQNLVTPITPAVPSSDLPPPPIIQVSEHLTPYDSAPAQIQSQTGGMGTTEKPTNPIGIMAGQRRQERDVFDESGDEEDNTRRRRHDSDSSDEEEEEEEDDGDFSDDDEEEEEIRTTSTAAGVEKISRHREQNQAQSATQAQLQPPTTALSV